MKPVQPGERIIANIHEAEYEPFINEDGQMDGSVLQLNREHKPALDSTFTGWLRVPRRFRTNIEVTKNFY